MLVVRARKKAVTVRRRDSQNNSVESYNLGK
jgi:hypothetical protein